MPTASFADGDRSDAVIPTAQTSVTATCRFAFGSALAQNRCVRGVLWLFAIAGCHEPTVYDVVTGPRDWSAHPAIVSIEAPGDVYAVSDIHGGYERFVALLVRYGLADRSGVWTGGNATLVVTGDLFDKGPKGLEVVDFLRTLQSNAGDHVIVTLGNHEAEFFADPTNSKADGDDGIDTELAADAIDPVAIASGADDRGLWLRQRPFAARVGDWFFAHAGNTHGRTLAELDDVLRTGFDANDFRDAELTGSDSILESRDWFAAATSATSALGVHHIVFGHDPNALGPRGAIAHTKDRMLFRIDCGMSPDVNDSQGALLAIHADGTTEQLAADGAVLPLP